MPYSSMILEKYDQPQWYRSALRASVGAVAINGAVFALAVMGGIFESFRFRPVVGGAVTIGPVLIASAAIPVFAFAAYLALEHAQGVSYAAFRAAAWIAIALSMLLPYQLASTLPQIAILQITHLVVGVYTLHEFAQWAELTGRRKT